MKGLNHHPECRMPACGIEGKYCPDCAGWQRATAALRENAAEITSGPTESNISGILASNGMRAHWRDKNSDLFESGSPIVVDFRSDKAEPEKFYEFNCGITSYDQANLIVNSLCDAVSKLRTVKDENTNPLFVCDWCLGPALIATYTMSLFNGEQRNFCCGAHELLYAQSYGFRRLENGLYSNHHNQITGTGQSPASWKLTEWLTSADKSTETLPGKGACTSCGKSYEVMLPERFLNENAEESTYLFCSIGCFEKYKKQHGVIEIYPGIYHVPTPQKWIEGPSEEIREKIEKFMHDRFGPRAFWKVGITGLTHHELPDVLEQFLFWYMDNQ